MANEDIIRKLVETRREELKKEEPPELANYSYPIEKFQIPELPLLSTVDRLPEKYDTDLEIKKILAFNLVYDKKQNKWIFLDTATIGGGVDTGVGIPKNPTIVNPTVPTAVWTKIADLPNNVRTWTLKSRENNFDFRVAFKPDPLTWITIPAGVIYGESTNPSAIYVYHDQFIHQIFELIYWTP